MLAAILLVLLIVLIYAPQWWVKHVLKKHAKPLDHLPGTGGELAQHLVASYQLEGVSVEETELGDHYDPENRAVRLSPDVYAGRSLTAVAVAAHEVGHAIQYHREEEITKLRQQFTPLAMTIERISIAVLMLLPLLMAIIRVPQIALFIGLAAFIGIVVSALLQLVILPLEWDASFNKALPILMEGKYIQEDEYDAVRSVLKAAAFTYLAAALASILRIGRWWAILRGAIR